MAGQIIGRGDRTWLVRVFLGRDENGKRQYHNKTVHGNKKDAERERNKLLTARDGGTLTIFSESLIIGDMLEDVIHNYRINGQDAEWAKLVIANLKPTFGKMAFSAIRPSHVDKYIQERKAAGRANATINHELSILRRAFNLARKKGTISAVPFHIAKLEENNVRKGFFEHADYRKLLDKLPAELKPVLTFAYYTGCRKGEVLNLRWSQVDLIGRMIRLEPGETKNSEARVIPLRVEELHQTIRMQRALRDQQYPDCPWVFCRDGQPILNFRKSWETACESAGLWDSTQKRPTRIFHDLRRTGVRNLIRAGVPEKVAMLISGHKTRSVFERYNIVDERDVIDAMSRLDTYTRDRAVAEKDAAEKAAVAFAESWHTIGTQRQKRAS
ncbi:MAG: site-specific integrase [Acidobacteriia bacterium]|nr:site-specific integrase [Terriglobia bacterium]